MVMKRIYIKISLLLFLPLGMISCSEDALEPELSTVRDVGDNPISTETDVMYLVNGMYKKLRSSSYYGRDFIIFNEARTDNAYSVGYSNRFVTVSEMRINRTDAYPLDTWRAMYGVILNANYVINAENVSGNAEAVDDYIGQAYLGRALAHFDLLKLYGQQHIDGQGGVNALTIPYVTSFPTNSDEGIVFDSQRIKFAEVRDLIYADLDNAISRITNTDAKSFTKQAALGYKSRIAMYFATFYPQDWQVALDTSTEALALGGDVIVAGDFTKQFSGNGIDVNAVFQLAVPSNDNLGNDCLAEIYVGDAYGDILAQEGTVDLFEDGDVRASVIGIDSWEDLRNLMKYNQYSDDIILMRYEELLLNAAEASVRLGNAALAAEHINRIREKRGDGVTLSTFATITLEEVLLERRKELMFEGFRYDDVLRLQMTVPANPRLEAGIPYGDYRLSFPIPQNEINASGMQQNFGY